MKTANQVGKRDVERIGIESILRNADVSIKSYDIIEDAAFGMFLIGVDRRVVYVNAAFCNLLGYSLEECIGRDVVDLIHPDERKEVTKKQAHLAEGRIQNYTVERKYLHKDGSAIPVLSTVFVYTNSDNEPQLIASQLIDMSALKDAEAQLVTSEQRSTFALEGAGQGVWDSNQKTGKIYHSDMWREMRGIALDDEKNTLDDWFNRIHPEDLANVRRAVREQAEGNFEDQALEFRERHANGNWMWILSRGHAIEWGLDGLPSRIIGTDTDITHLKEGELALEDASNRLELALSTSKIGVWNADLVTGRVQWDNLLRDIFERPDIDITDVPRDLWEKSLHPDDAVEAMATIQHVIKSKSFVDLSYRVILPNGTIKHIHSTVRYFVDTYGNKKILGTKRDVSEEVAASTKLENALALAETNSAKLQSAQVDMEVMARRMEMAVSTSGVGVWELDLKTDVVTWDDATKELYGQMDVEGNIAPEGVWFTSLHPEDTEEAMHQAGSAIKTRGKKSSNYRIIRPDGTMRHIHEICRSYVDSEGEEKFIGVCRDITDEVDSAENLRQAKILAEQKSAQLEIAMDVVEKNSAELESARAAMEFNSLHDALTGLPNRRYLDEKLVQASNANNAESACLLHIDLDRFKQINDTLGHAAGDTMLVHTAEVLQEMVGPGNFTARVGGDEFVVLLNEDKTDDELALLAKTIVKRMRKPIIYEGHECRTGVSVGISRKKGLNITPKKMLINADIALYRAKEKGRNRYEFFTEELEAEITNTKRLADEILTGLEKEQFFAFYQPQFDANTLEIVGVEALARWNHPTKGILAPDSFLKIAEDLNVVPQIDRLILEQSLNHMDSWHEAGLAIPKVSVNVSARRLQDDALIPTLKKLKFRPGTLSFELLESIFLDDSDEGVTWNIDQIKELGIEIDIDDFGSGHASIIGLLKLNPHRLKIDQQLIRPMDKSEKQLNLVKSIVDIGKSLGVQIVAEGVETMEHVRLLRALGCDVLQGYVFAKPMCVQDLVVFIKNRAWQEVA